MLNTSPNSNLQDAAESWQARQWLHVAQLDVDAEQSAVKRSASGGACAEALSKG